MTTFQRVAPRASAFVARLQAAAAVLIALGAAACGIASAQPAAPPSEAEKSPKAKAEGVEIGRDWVRVANDEDGKPRAMQVAIVRYRGDFAGAPCVVDLVGAVHVGDAAYYEKLNEHFRQYDALLYELVAPEGTVVEPEDVGKNRNVLGSMQNGMKSMLELDHQLEKIDYKRANFVHADMSPDEFFKSMKDHDGGMLQMYFRMVGMGIAAQSKQAAEGSSMDLELIQALFARNRARQLKIVMAKQMAEVESMLQGMAGANGSTLITERNKACMKVLRRELVAGKARIGVFYGAGHLNDMDERLRNDFKLQPEEITWFDAWDLRAE